jgi:hypothetical protein
MKNAGKYMCGIFQYTTLGLCASDHHCPNWRCRRLVALREILQSCKKARADSIVSNQFHPTGGNYRIGLPAISLTNRQMGHLTNRVPALRPIVLRTSHSTTITAGSSGLLKKMRVTSFGLALGALVLLTVLVFGELFVAGQECVSLADNTGSAQTAQKTIAPLAQKLVLNDNCYVQSFTISLAPACT